MAPKTQTRPPYRMPFGTMIDRGSHTEKLYELEESRNKAIRAAAKELQKILQLEDFWREAMPEALLNILESFDHEASTLAAQAFLGKHARGN